MGEGFDALAFAVEDQSLEVDAGPPGGLGLGEVLGEQVGVVTQAIEDCRVKSWSVGLHATSERRIPSADSDL